MPKEELSKEEMDAFVAAKATWQKDGFGIKGDVVQVSNSKANLVFESKVVYRRPELDSQAT